MSNYKKYFTLSYDDGLEQDKQLIVLMKKYGIRGTFNLNSGLLGRKENVEYIGSFACKNVEKDVEKNGFVKTCTANRIPEDEIRQVYADFELATHGVNHIMMHKLSAEDVEKEIVIDRQILQKYTDIPVVGHAYPFGLTSPTVKQALKKHGFIYARGIKKAKGKGESRFSFSQNPLNFNPTCSHIDKNLLPLFMNFKETQPIQGDMIFYLWGHSYEFDFYIMKEKHLAKTIEQIFDMVANDDSIIPCTNAEAFAMHSSMICKQC